MQPHSKSNASNIPLFNGNAGIIVRFFKTFCDCEVKDPWKRLIQLKIKDHISSALDIYHKQLISVQMN